MLSSNRILALNICTLNIWCTYETSFHQTFRDLMSPNPMLLPTNFPHSKSPRRPNREQTLCQKETCSLKGTQEWEFFWLRFWILYYFIVSYVKILRFCIKNFLIGPVLEEVRFFRVVLGLRGMKKFFELGQKNIFNFFIYEPFIWANTSFFEIRSIYGARDGFLCQSWAKMSKFILLSLRLSGIEFSLVSD